MERTCILLVDNHPEVLIQIEKCLSYEEDLKVCKISSLSEVTESINECKPDILLIDPYVDNVFDYDTIRVAKQIIPFMTVIVLTAVVDSATQVELRRAGAEYILEKSIDSQELKDTIRKVIARKHQRD